MEQHAHGNNPAHHGSLHSLCSRADGGKYSLSGSTNANLNHCRSLFQQKKAARLAYARQETEKTLVLDAEELTEVDIHTCEDLNVLAEENETVEDEEDDLKLCEEENKMFDTLHVELPWNIKYSTM